MVKSLPIEKICIGSAQFGFDYGVTNQEGIVPPSEVKEILSLAFSNGIRTIDTAKAYGKSEEVLGQCLQAPFRIITKVLNIQDDDPQTGIHTQVQRSLHILRKTNLEAVLFHDVSEFLRSPAEYSRVMERMKSDGAISKFGVSLYTPEQALDVLNYSSPDVVQFPLNVFDQRFITSGIASEMKKRGIECHVRSVMLQGVILQRPEDLDPFFDFFRPRYLEYYHWVGSHRLSLLEGALKFVLESSFVDKIILGVCSVQQLEQILHSARTAISVSPLNFDQWKTVDERLINPLFWPMLKRG